MSVLNIWCKDTSYKDIIIKQGAKMKRLEKGKAPKKKTRQGLGKRTKYGRPGPNGGNKGYKKRYRGQGKKR